MIPPVFDDAFRAGLRELFVWRRDVRRFRPDPVPDALLAALIETACLAPSVGLSEPWRFVRVRDPDRRAAIRANFACANEAALAAQPEDRAGLYARLKLAGLDDAPEHLAVFVDPEPTQGHGLGRATMPETVLFSAVMAVHTFWLAARAAGLGVGWVSILDPAVAVAALDAKPGWQLVAYLCVGWPEDESGAPELERLRWERRHSNNVLER